MLIRQPAYEVGFLEHDKDNGILGKRWVSAVMSGFDEDSSRHRQAEKALGRLGNPIIDGVFMMRRMRDEELQALLDGNGLKGGTPISHTAEVDELKALIAYPHEGEDLDRIRDGRVECAAPWLACIDMVRTGESEEFGLMGTMITLDNADSLAEEIRGSLGPLYPES